MGSGNIFKAIIGSKRGKQKSDKGVKSKSSKKKGTHASSPVVRSEDWAATRIQAAFKAYKAKKILRRLQGSARAKLLTEKHSVKKQAVVTLRYLHSWSKIQSQIKARRVCMVTESRLMHKRLENQQKLEAKLHDIEVEWNGGSETKDEILGRIHQREEATIKRERALAYAFSHQWKADGKTQWLGGYELGNTNWGWSWKERWISARPWEVRYSVTPKKPKSSKTVVGGGCNKETNSKRAVSLSLPSASSKAPFSGARNAVKPRRLSFPGP
uniref:Protein IQ-DOMAIN 1 n=1 Tax=Noccaea caerulescens TaxID=107243 RepID=A0A1J3ERU1_NOCCA